MGDIHIEAVEEMTTRTQLERELERRVSELRKMKDGWDGDGSRRPLSGALATVLVLGRAILDQTDEELPHALNISAARNGAVCFTLFGKDGREVELWMGEAPHHVSFLAFDGDEGFEGRIDVEEFSLVGAWLNGHADSI